MTTPDEAREQVRRGAWFGDVAEQLPEADRAELAAWFVAEPGVPTAEVVRSRLAAMAARVRTPTGDACTRCGGLMVRTGTCLTCSACGDTSGCG